MPDNRFEWLRRAVVLFSASFLLWLIYANPPLTLKRENSDKLRALAADLMLPADKETPSLLLDEHRKVTDEIKMHNEDENELFRYKFALVGGLLVAFLAHIAYPLRGGASNTLDGRIESLLKSSATCSVLALACVIAVAIDIHIRTATIVSNQLGLWIANVIEPAFLRQPSCGYENFLRSTPIGSGLHGMHADDLYGFMYWPPLHFLTWVLYLIYLTVFQNVCAGHSRHRLLVFAGFVFVHSSVWAFAWMGHTAPSAFEFQPVPFAKNWLLSGWRVPVLYSVPSSLLFVLNSHYLMLLKSANQEGHQHSR